MSPRRKTMLQEVIEEMAEKARTGTPDMGWTCGQCGLDGKQGVRVFYHKRVLEVRRGKEIVDFDMVLICPNCSHAPAKAAS